MKKKILSMLLMCCMLLALMPVTAMALRFDVMKCVKCGGKAPLVELKRYSPTYHGVYYKCDDCGTRFLGDLEEHSLEYHEGKTPTCTEKGWNAYYTCAECEYNTYEELRIDSNNHDLVHHDAQTPNCTQIGWEAYDTCTRCNYSTYQEIPKKHDLVHHEGKEQTCTERGWAAYDTCRLCDYTTYQRLGPHFMELFRYKAATCTEIGWVDHYECSRCGLTPQYYKTFPALGHDPVQHKGKAPTCTEKGWAAYETCTRCDYSTYQELPAQHTIVHHDAQAPTCTEVGWNAYDTCKNCDYSTYKELSIDLNNHDLVHHDAQAPTCTEKGWEAYETCKREGCEYTTYKELSIDLNNHDLEPHEGKAPTCTEIGWEAYETCTRCDYSTYEELPVLTHDYKQTVVNPTCTEGGYTRYTCSLCEDTYTGNSVQKLLHQYGDWVSNGDGTHTRTCKFDAEHTEKANCHGGTATCKDRAVCDDCKQPYGELDPKNHTNLQHFPAKVATTTSEGNIEYWYCDGCGRYYSDRGATQEIQKADTAIARLKGNSQSPKTGNNSNLTLWIALLCVSGASAAATIVVSRKRKYNR